MSPSLSPCLHHPVYISLPLSVSGSCPCVHLCLTLCLPLGLLLGICCCLPLNLPFSSLFASLRGPTYDTKPSGPDRLGQPFPVSLCLLLWSPPQHTTPSLMAENHFHVVPHRVQHGHRPKFKHTSGQPLVHDRWPALTIARTTKKHMLIAPPAPSSAAPSPSSQSSPSSPWGA